MTVTSKAGQVSPCHSTGIPQPCREALESTGQGGRTGASLLRSNLLGRQSTALSSDSGAAEAVRANIPSSVLQLLVPPSALARLNILHAAERATMRGGAIWLHTFL